MCPVLETFVHDEPLRHTVDVQEHIYLTHYLELVCLLLLGDYYQMHDPCGLFLVC
jgi:hypothetical protein